MPQTNMGDRKSRPAKAHGLAGDDPAEFM